MWCLMIVFFFLLQWFILSRAKMMAWFVHLLGFCTFQTGQAHQGGWSPRWRLCSGSLPPWSSVYGNSSLGLLHPFYPGISFPSAWEILPAPICPESTVLYLLFLEIHLLPRFDYFLIGYMISSWPAWMIQLERPRVLGRSFLLEHRSDH